MAKPKLVINNQQYEAVVLLIRSHDEFGRPREATTLYDEESVNIEGGEEFMIVFAPSSVVQRKVGGTA